MLDKAPLLLTVLIHYNSPQDCYAITKDLEKCDYTNQKIVIVDNQSSDTSFKELESLLTNTGCYLVRNSSNNGYGGGINFGVEYGAKFNPKYIQVMNTDTRVINFSYLSEMVTQLEALPLAGVIGPAVKTVKGNIQNTIMPFGSLYNIFNFRKNFSSLSYIEKTPNSREVEVLNGVCFLVSYNAFQQVNGFDEDFFMYGEEQDFCYRIKKVGYQNYFFSSESIVHYEKSCDDDTAESFDWKYFLVRSNQIMYIKKNRNHFEGYGASLVFLISTIKKFLLGGRLKNISIMQIWNAFFLPVSFNRSFIKMEK